MSRLLFVMKSGDNAFFWALFSVGITLAFLYSVDMVTGADLMHALWTQIRRF